MMKQRLLNLLTLIAAVVALGSCGGGAVSSSGAVQRETDFNFDWKFTLLEDTTTLENLPLDDSAWRDVRLPHDWSVEASFDEGLEGCTGYLPGGVGVYQKHFETPYSSDEKSTYVLFDGVYNNAKFWLNGVYLGENPYGYSPTYFDLTEALKPVGEENVLSVYVDHSRYADSRWYTGSGIYRDVTLVTLDKVSIPIWGTFVTTPQIEIGECSKVATSALVNINVAVQNQNEQSSELTLVTTILDGEGKAVGSSSAEYTVDAGESENFDQQITLSDAALWDCEDPNMYSALTQVSVGGVVVDEYTTPFGIRELTFDKDKGFFLNGVNTFVKGVCLHHDGGLVGAAVPRGVWERRLQVLKDGGVNAIRLSHNPFSEEFLDICDEMGLLVQNELFDEMDNPKDKRFNMNEREVLYRTRGYTEHFQEWGESDLKRVMLRDRNHPSVFQWSIGNEIEWTYPHYQEVSGLWDPGTGGYWNKIPHLTPEQMKARYDALPEREYVLAETAKRLSKWVKEMDTTRPVTANLIIPVASCVTGYADALDIVGFSYQIAQYDWCKKHFPHMHFTGNENTGLLEEWHSITENPMVFSMYMWTGIDYMGESNLRWPQKAWPGDMVDLAGFTKAGWNHFRAIWDDEPFIRLQTHRLEDSPFKYDEKSGKLVPKKGNPNEAEKWNNTLSEEIWDYEDGELIVVEVVTNGFEAAAYLNGNVVGRDKRDKFKDNIMRWVVPYKAGTLDVRGTANGRTVRHSLKTPGKPASIVVDIDKSALAADGYDVAHIVAQVVDKDGTPIKSEECELTFTIEGDINLLGVDNGWNKSTQDFQTNKLTTHLGRGLALIQSFRDKPTTAKITVSAEGLPSQSVELSCK